jgi:hypothetical protein
VLAEILEAYCANQQVIVIQHKSLRSGLHSVLDLGFDAAILHNQH